MSILFISLDFSNISNTSKSILRRGETQQTSGFQNYLDILLNISQSYSFMLIIIESGTSTSLILVVLFGYSIPQPPTPKLLTLYTLHRYLTSIVLIYKLLFLFQLTIKSVFLRYSTLKPSTLEPLTLYSSTPKLFTPELLTPYSLTPKPLLQKLLSSYSLSLKLSISKLLTLYLFNLIIS